jgi:hypothetical protein
MSIECGIVKRHFRVEADESFATWKLGRWNHGEGIHLNKISVTLARNLYEAGGNQAELLEQLTAQSNAEAESARLERKESTVRVGDFANDGRRILGGNLFNLHATRGGGHNKHATRGSINQRGEIDLANDRGCWGNQDTSHGELIYGEGKDRGSGCLGLRRTCGELDAAGLTSPADEDLGLDDDLGYPTCEEAFGDGAGASGGGGHICIRDGETGSRKKLSRLSLVDLHPCLLPLSCH